MKKEKKITKLNAKPFLKWAGGKTQLLDILDYYLPKELKHGEIENYYEPFLGSGALFFYINQKYKIRKAFLSDVNQDLVNAFNTVKNNIDKLIEELEELSSMYNSLKHETGRKKFYERTREQFNNYIISSEDDSAHKTGLLIFLNKTCYNGLYRVNSRGKFNVPFGRHKNPKILDRQNLLSVSRCLQNAEIKSHPYFEIEFKLKKNSFVYYDPPYLPISKTSNFTSYHGSSFGIQEQEKLAELFIRLDEKNIKQMVSNSDPKHKNPKNAFFEDLYSGYNINRANAKRFINSDASKRGIIKELIITNY